MTTNKVSLTVLRKEGVNLLDALQDWKAELAGAAGLVGSATKFQVLSLAAISNGGTAGLKNSMGCAPFEARFFNGGHELRWVAEPSLFDPEGVETSTGTAVLLSESTLQKDGWTPGMPPLDIVAAKQNHYILWGKMREINGGMAVFFDHRIGDLSIPEGAFQGNPPASGAMGRVIVKEYIAGDDNHGNCAVVAERLCGWDWIACQPQKKEA